MTHRPHLALAARILPGVALAIGGSVLLLWWLTPADFPVAHPFWMTQKANTALGLLLLAGAGLAWERPAGRALAGAAALVGGLTFLQYATGRDLGLDQLLVKDATPPALGAPGRMAPSTAFNLLALGLVALAPRRLRPLRQALLALAAALTFLAVVGHAFGVPALYGMGTPTVMALNTAAGLIALQLLFLIRLERTFCLEILGRGGIIRFFLRRFLPMALILPLALDWIRFQAEQSGHLLREDSLALGSVTHSLVLLGLGLWTLVSILRLEAGREAAQAELERYKQIVDHQTLALTVLHLEDPARDESLRVVGFNPTAQRTFDLDPARDLGRPFVELFPSLKGTTRLHQYAEVARTGRPVDMGDVVYGDARRAPVTYAVKAFPLPGGYAGIAAEDASERVKVQKLKDEFVSMVSHELRTPLTSIQGSLDLLRGGVLGALPPPVQNLLDVASQNGRRLAKLIEDLLNLERLQTGRIEFHFETVDARELAVQTLAALTPFAGPLGVRLALEAPEGRAFPLRTDADRLQQVLTNLISNAAKHSPKGAVVRVRLIPLEDRIRIEVIDRGPGIPEAFRSQIFGKFAQAETGTTRAQGGAGLGLYIAKKMVEHLDGTIGFESEVGMGTTFFVELPT
ncbi:MAG TPA: ATP-binding protein [Holophagaceae bacterium]|nr:ATP-binding protein [Holophagaceae bacterium]